jgi:DNA gyrase subunit A
MDLENKDRIIPISIEEEMRTAYIDYSMSVIVSRALPDVRDGLKPVHRRVLYGMNELGFTSSKAFKKSARIVGDVLAKYHPHGEGSVYDSLVRMAQSWSLRYTLVSGQGNFGSIDGDSPAAMRYTEAKLSKISEELLADIHKNTVTFQANFDDSLVEPTVLPTRIPNLLINGSSGIAVGMSTNMAPHNLTEVIDCIINYIDTGDMSIEDIIKYIKAPDFPTGGIIYGYEGVREAFFTGRGRVVIRAKVDIQVTSSGKEQIIVTELPYMVNKALMIEKTAQLVNEKKLNGISDIRDESDKDGMRIVYDIRRDTMANVVLNNLYKYTSLQSSYSINNVALVNGRPKLLNIKELIVCFIDHRIDVVTKRTRYDLANAEKRIHIYEGFLIVLDNLEGIIELIKASKDPSVARAGLIEKYNLTEAQAKAILEMRLQRLTGMERDKIIKEHQALSELIVKLKEILDNHHIMMKIIKDELIDIKQQYGDVRKTAIEYNADELTMQDMIPNQPVVITISNQGYIKVTPLSEYKTQNRAGVGAKAVAVKQDDYTQNLFIASMHDYLLLFTHEGKLYWQRVYAIPQSGKSSQGRAIQNIIEIASSDSVKSIVKVSDLNNKASLEDYCVIMCTEKGMIKKTPLQAYANPRNKGIYAINIKEGDQLLEAKLVKKGNHIVMATKSGRAIHFTEEEIVAKGRKTSGVRGITLADENDKVIGMVSLDPKENKNLLVLSEKGYGKYSNIQQYRITKRGGKGIKTLNVTSKTGALVAINSVSSDDNLMIINKSGIAINISLADMRPVGRVTQGVRLIKLTNNDEIAAAKKVEKVDL